MHDESETQIARIYFDSQLFTHFSNNGLYNGFPVFEVSGRKVILAIFKPGILSLPKKDRTVPHQEQVDIDD